MTREERIAAIKNLSEKTYFSDYDEGKFDLACDVLDLIQELQSDLKNSEALIKEAARANSVFKEENQRLREKSEWELIDSAQEFVAEKCGGLTLQHIFQKLYYLFPKDVMGTTKTGTYEVVFCCDIICLSFIDESPRKKWSGLRQKGFRWQLFDQFQRVASYDWQREEDKLAIAQLLGWSKA